MLVPNTSDFVFFFPIKLTEKDELKVNAQGQFLWHFYAGEKKNQQRMIITPLPVDKD